MSKDLVKSCNKETCLTLSIQSFLDLFDHRSFIFKECQLTGLTQLPGEMPAGGLGQEEIPEARKVGMCTCRASNVGRNQNVLWWEATEGHCAGE